MKSREMEAVVGRLRAAVGAVLATDRTDMPAWGIYQDALTFGLHHLQSQIPPTRYPSLSLHEKDCDHWDRLALVAAVPVSLFNRLLPCQRKLGFGSFAAAYAHADMGRLKAPFELASYWHHDLMCGRTIMASLLEIVSENRFLTPGVRNALRIIESANKEQRLSVSVLQDAIRGQTELVADLLRGCYLCLRHASGAGVVQEAEATGANGFVLCTGLMLQALGQFNEQAGNEPALSSEDADCLKSIGQMTLALEAD